MNQYKNLLVWKKARTLVKEIYLWAETLPKHELYALSDQIRRAAISIPSNIAEGSYRESIKEQIQFLSIARWSLAELETQILLAEDLGYISLEKSQEFQDILTEISKMLVSLMKKKRSFLL
jgi:four helix bundle protein